MNKKSLEEVKAMSAEEKLAYQRALNKARQDRYKEAHKKESQEYKKDYIKKYRQEHKEKYKELNVEHNKKYRANLKAMKGEIAKKQEANNAVKEFLNELVDSIPNEVAKKKNRERVGKHRGKKSNKRTLNLTL